MWQASGNAAYMHALSYSVYGRLRREMQSQRLQGSSLASSSAPNLVEDGRSRLPGKPTLYCMPGACRLGLLLCILLSIPLPHNTLQMQLGADERTF